MGRKLSAILIIAIVAALAIIATVFTVAAGVFDPYEQQIRLGYKYLASLDYEQTIIAFDKAIEIDAKKDKAYIGLSDAYVARLDGNALQDIETALKNGFEQHYNDENIIQAFLRLPDALYGKGHEDWAIDLLTFAYDLTSDERIQSKKADLINKYAKGILENLYEMFDSGNDDAVKQEIQSDKYVQFMNYANEGFKLIYFPDGNTQQTGKGVALYYVDTADYGNVFVYYGDYVNGLREGTGLWVGAKDSQFYWFDGAWSNDFPNGYGDVKEWNEKLQEGMTVRNLKGSLSNGLWNGDMNWNFVYPDRTVEWTLNFTNGNTTAEKDNNDPDHPYRIAAIDGDGHKTTMGFCYDPAITTYGIVGFDDDGKLE